MALPSSPSSISLNQVNTELGFSATAIIAMNDAAVRTLFGVASGAISMSNGYGKANSLAVNYLVVSGGNIGQQGGGGGGAGGYISTSASLSKGTAFTVTVAAGGSTPGQIGPSSSFNGTAPLGGGSTVNRSYTDIPGGSGYGQFYGPSFGYGTAGQGNNGGAGYYNGGCGAVSYGGGGGGAGAAGGGPGAGGAGLTWYDGITRAGGGGGTISYLTYCACGPFWYGQSGYAGGAGGGGTGASSDDCNGYTAGVSGSANTGGGGGSGAINGTAGPSGGSGVVVIRYAGSQVATGGTVTSSGGYTYHTFTTSGTFTT